jgi:D-alanine-D-alanine ligase
MVKSIPQIAPSRLSQRARERLKILFVAKHAMWQGGLHPEDGNHAIYHQEMRRTLRLLGINLAVADSYDVLFDKPNVDFVFPLLNRGGFLNSEMLLPLLCLRHGIPYLGASPILRGLSDDKHLTKLEAKARRVPTSEWATFRRGAPINPDCLPQAQRWVIKPNASSASWGVSDAHDVHSVIDAVEVIHGQGHDAIVEPFLSGSDAEVPVIMSGGRPIILPIMMFEQDDPSLLRSYAEKRDLADRSQSYRDTYFDEPMLARRIRAMTQTMIEVFHPFDYGRFEYRVDPVSGDVQFMEVNLNCNLWSKKIFSQSAALAGLSHADLIETILAESMIRQGLSSGGPQAGSPAIDYRQLMAMVG